MDLFDSQIVFNDRSIIAAFGIGQPALCIEQQIQQPQFLTFVGIFVDSFEGLELLLAGQSAIEIGLRDGIGSLQFGQSTA